MFTALAALSYQAPATVDGEGGAISICSIGFADLACLDFGIALATQSAAGRQPVQVPTGLRSKPARTTQETTSTSAKLPPEVRGCASLPRQHNATCNNKRRRIGMNKTQSTAREASASFLSSIINLICPLCGGSMMGFRCWGTCGQDWRSDWEAAIRPGGRIAPKF